MAIRHADVLLFALAAPMMAAMAAPSQASTYRNGEYGVQATVPDGLRTCPVLSWTHEHGIGIILDGGRDCHVKAKTAMSIIADYNVLWDDLAAIREALCKPDKTQHIVNAPDLPRLGGLPSAVCRRESGDGEVELQVLAVVGNPQDGIYYSAWLFTTEDRLDGDLPAFRDFLKAVHFFKPDNP
ncbi:MAG TPA: hypothetical protein VG798_00765 [Rhizomicrobium sp.]|nr:hypothetical protein [Rhizomicrobium sp.]